MVATRKRRRRTARPQRVFALIPFSVDERLQLKHAALDAHQTLGGIIRKKLGFPPTVGGDADPMR